MIGEPQKLEKAARLLLLKLLELKELNPTPIVLIDGRSGSGKSTLANLLANLVFQEDRQSPKVIHMDDVYPGWEGLEAGSLYLTQQILKPLRAEGRAEWQRWDWSHNTRGGGDEGNGWRSFEGQNLLIVEGCGSITKQSRELGDLTIWVESDTETRKARFLSRDGGKFADHWASWSAQEDGFYESTKSRSLASLRIEN